jgi:hypothetical protein
MGGWATMPVPPPTLYYYDLLLNSSEDYLGPSFFSFVVEFRELSDGEWEVIRLLLPLGLVLGDLGLMIGLL